ncbi:MAG TPA: thioredoxin family protein [bacterium]|nr:thioredoxin family protein [Myxococcales bacterium]OQA58716.1 MAG: hypothetical protein BWY40_01435 [bacterium ADurb.Bin270]HPW44999.1 thioredoxin family protein [bacterium]
MKKMPVTLIIAVVFGLSFVFSCSDKREAKEVKSFEVKENPYHFEDIVIGTDGEIADCSLRQLDGRLIFITSKYCPHCKRALPIVEKIIADKKLQDIYEHVDTTTEEGQDILSGAGISVQYVPALIYDCKAYVGGGDAAKYDKILSGGVKK